MMLQKIASKSNLATLLLTITVAAFFNIQDLHTAIKRVNYERNFRSACEINLGAQYQQIEDAEGKELLHDIPERYWDLVLRGNDLSERKARSDCIRSAVNNLSNYPIRQGRAYTEGDPFKLVIFPFIIISLLLAVVLVIIKDSVNWLFSKSAVVGRASLVALPLVVVGLFAIQTRSYDSFYQRGAQSLFYLAALMLLLRITVRIKDWVMKGR